MAFKASQLGFVNPVSVAWQLVPFSFVVDWFVNVGQFIGSYTDFVGVEQSNPCVTRYQVADCIVSANNRPYVYEGLSIYVRRTLGIPSPSLKVRPWNGVSPVRAATAIALLIQQL